jgi:4-carboxymuconolactone decarboxylase
MRVWRRASRCGKLTIRTEDAMARIPLFPLEPPHGPMTAEQRRVYDAIVAGPRGKVEGPLRVTLHQPTLTDKWQALGAELRFRTSLPPRLSELVILIVARHWTSQFEWYAHAPIARDAGVADAAIAAIRAGQEPAFAHDDEQIVYDYVTELQTRHAVGEATYQRALDALDTVGVVELTALMGYYTMVAMTLIAHEIPLPDGTQPPLPPL